MAFIRSLDRNNSVLITAGNIRAAGFYPDAVWAKAVA
jgi:hypothetical protein